MAAINWNELPYQKSFNLKQGDGLSFPVRLKIKAEAATTYSDLTLVGCTISLYMKTAAGTAVTGYNPKALTADTAAEGKITILIPGADTGSWSGNYIYELQVTFPTGHTNFASGLVKTVMEGSISIRADI